MSKSPFQFTIPKPSRIFVSLHIQTQSAFNSKFPAQRMKLKCKIKSQMAMENVLKTLAHFNKITITAEWLKNAQRKCAH